MINVLVLILQNISAIYSWFISLPVFHKYTNPKF